MAQDISNLKEARNLLTEIQVKISNIEKGYEKANIAQKKGLQDYGAQLEAIVSSEKMSTKEMVKRTNLPITVKTRLGWDEKSIKIIEVAEKLQDVGISAISIHGRTRAQMYKGEADWTKIAEVKNNPRMKIPVFGNGDVNTPEKAKLMKDYYGLDGAMIGRACIGNPWFFDQVKYFL